MSDVSGKSEAPAAKVFQLVGGALCLDFTNTLGGKRGSSTRECLNNYADFLSWSRQTGSIDQRQAAVLAGRASKHPGEAAKVLALAIELRETVYRLCAAVIEKRAPAKSDLEILNRELARALGRRRLIVQGGGFGWTWANDPPDLSHLLAPLAKSAAEILTSLEDLRHLCRCEGDNCGWLFLDSSKNHSRKWCDMRDCGNRAKVRRHRVKQKDQLPETG